MLQQVDAMNTLRHPGPVLTERARSATVMTLAMVRLTVPCGHDLFETVHAALDARDVAGGSFTLVSGTVTRLSLMTGGPGSDGLPMGFHGPHSLAAPLDVVAGAAGSGIDETGARFTHCHACFRDRLGQLVGGHLITGDTIAGDSGIVLDLTPIVDGRFARQFDRETHFTIFHPEQV